MRANRITAIFVLCITASAVMFASAPYAFAETAEEQRARLQQELTNIEADIQAKRGVLEEKQRERTSLERDVAILDNKISQAQLSIKKSDVSIRQLQGEISDKVKSIDVLNDKVDRAHASLAQLVRRTHQVDETTLVELLLGGSMSEMLDDIDDFTAIQRELDVAFDEIARIKDDLSARKRTLEERESETTTLRKIQVLEKRSVESNKSEKAKILTATKGEEKEYQKIIAEREKSAAEIRTALFGLRDSAAIPLGTAYDYAKQAGEKTGVRPALILAILTQESNLGENVGSCFVRDLSSGDGVGKNTGATFEKIMKAPRDTEPFVEITRALGFDWSTTPISCPIGGYKYYSGRGFGGAMGPSQFIPSTWVLYIDRLSVLTGESMPNPWNARTAIFATALLMEDNGASAGTRVAERRAALRYFAGGNWNNPKNARYGDSVMELVDGIQRQIDILEG